MRDGGLAWRLTYAAEAGSAQPCCALAVEDSFPECRFGHIHFEFVVLLLLRLISVAEVVFANV